ncbi:hypothetical protein GCM10010245_50020 [Streptomyces spectabilis]|nr:hypothetical protein GCM10010245_50020 [Streptomyces spectabilis]
MGSRLPGQFPRHTGAGTASWKSEPGVHCGVSAAVRRAEPWNPCQLQPPMPHGRSDADSTPKQAQSTTTACAAARGPKTAETRCPNASSPAPASPASSLVNRIDLPKDSPPLAAAGWICQDGREQECVQSA